MGTKKMGTKIPFLGRNAFVKSFTYIFDNHFIYLQKPKNISHNLN